MGLHSYVIDLLYGIDPLYIMILIAALPVAECRVAIPYGLSQGISPFVVFFGCFFSNILVVPVIFFFLEKLRFINLANFILGKRISYLVESSREKFRVYEELALFGFVAVPLPGTGAWTGTLLATVLRLDKRKSFMVISFGVFTACVIISLLSFGFIGFLSFF